MRFVRGEDLRDVNAPVTRKREAVAVAG
jgi:hypothetical protein